MFNDRSALLCPTRRKIIQPLVSQVHARLRDQAVADLEGGHAPSRGYRDPEERRSAFRVCLSCRIGGSRRHPAPRDKRTVVPALRHVLNRIDVLQVGAWVCERTSLLGTKEGVLVALLTRYRWTTRLPAAAWLGGALLVVELNPGWIVGKGFEVVAGGAGDIGTGGEDPRFRASLAPVWAGPASKEKALIGDRVGIALGESWVEFRQLRGEFVNRRKQRWRDRAWSFGVLLRRRCTGRRGRALRVALEPVEILQPAGGVGDGDEYRDGGGARGDGRGAGFPLVAAAGDRSDDVGLVGRQPESGADVDAAGRRGQRGEVQASDGRGLGSGR